MYNKHSGGLTCTRCHQTVQHCEDCYGKMNSSSPSTNTSSERKTKRIPFKMPCKNWEELQYNFLMRYFAKRCDLHNDIMHWKKIKVDISIFGCFLFKKYHLPPLAGFLMSQYLYFLSDEFNLSNGLKLLSGWIVNSETNKGKAYVKFAEGIYTVTEIKSDNTKFRILQWCIFCLALTCHMKIFITAAIKHKQKHDCSSKV